MKFNKTLLALAIPLAMAGCSSGGSDSADDNSGRDSADNTAISFSGRVADGYLSGATVCLDINENKKCDTSDPSATSVSGGAFSIVDATQAQRDKFPLLVEVVVDSTIDEDNKGIPLTKQLTLAAPAGYGFVSPLSTMVQNEVEAGVSPVDAEKIVQNKLGTTLGLDSDYVAGKTSGANTEEYAKLHQVAQVTARVISENMETLQDAAKENDISLDDLISAIVDEVFDALTEIIDQVEEATDFNPDTLAKDVNDEYVDLDASNIDHVVEQNEAEEAATAIDMHALLSNQALYMFETELDDDYQGSFSAYYGLVVKNDEQPGEYGWNANSMEFEAAEDEEKDSDAPYILNDSGQWIKVIEFWEPTSFSGATDSTFTVIRNRTGISATQVYNVREIDLHGLNVRTIMNAVDDDEQGLWGEYLPSTATFPAGSKGYSLQLTNTEGNDFYIFEDSSYCENEGHPLTGGICNTAYVHSPAADDDGLATSFAAVKVDNAYTLTGNANADHAGITGVDIAHADSYSTTLRAEIVNDGTVNYYKITDNNGNYGVSFLGASTWAAVSGSSVALELEWIQALRYFEGYDSDINNPVIALIGGYIRNAEHEGVRPQPIERASLVFLNSTATAAGIDEFGPENLDTED